MKRGIRCIALQLAFLVLFFSPVVAQETTYLPVIEENPICGDVTEIPQSECVALAALYFRTNGASWYYQQGWLANNSPCSWWGVSCENGHVVTLSLIGGFGRFGCFGNNLRGTLPPEIGNLSQLRSIFSCGNLALQGSIPRQWGRLTNLQRLELFDSGLNGQLPPELGNLSSLYHLNLLSNEFSGPIPPELGNLANLQYLNLAGNLLSGPVPESLGNGDGIGNIRALYLSGNASSLCIPITLTDFVTSLEAYHPPPGGVCK